MKRKVIPLLLAFNMILGSVPVVALEEPQENVSVDIVTSDETNISEEDIILEDVNSSADEAIEEENVIDSADEESVVVEEQSEDEISLTRNETISYYVYGDTMYIQGNGSMEGYESFNSPWSDYMHSHNVNKQKHLHSN